MALDHALYGTNTTDRINGLGGDDRMCAAANDANYIKSFGRKVA